MSEKSNVIRDKLLLIICMPEKDIGVDFADDLYK